MATLTNGELLSLQNTLQRLKENGALEGHAKLAYAADKSLKEVSSKLEAYEDQRQRLAEEHQQTDEEGRKLYRTEDGDVLAERDDPDDEEDAFVVVGKSGATITRQEAADAGAQFALDKEFYEELGEIQDEEVSVDLHSVDEDLFFEHAKIEDHGQINLTTLDPMLK